MPKQTSALPPGAGDGSQVRLFRRAMTRLEREIGPTAPDAACCGATVAQCAALQEIAALGRASLGRLAAEVGLDESTVSRTVDALVKRGLASREPSPEDRRAVVIALTPQGREAAAGLDRMLQDVYRRFLELVPEEKRAQVVESVALLAEAARAFNRAPKTESRAKETML